MNCGIKGGDVLSHAMQPDGMAFIPAARLLGAWIDDDKPYAGPSKARRLPASEAALSSSIKTLC